MDLSSLVLSDLADASIRSLCMAVLTLLALRLGRVRSVSVRHAVWTVALGAMLLLPFLTPFLPAIPVPILRSPTTAVLVPAQPSVPILAPGVDSSEPSALANRRSELALPSWQQTGLALYLGVLLVMLGRLFAGYLLARRLVGFSIPIRDVRASGFLERLAGDRAPALRKSGSISVPMTAGCIKPQILLPSGWQQWDRTKLEAALVHELAHVRRRDSLIALLAGLNKCIFWFHPLAWWMERKLALLAEEASDDCVLLVLGDRQRYASALLEMAAAVRAGRRRLLWEAIAMAKPSEVRQRIERVLDETSQISRGVTKGRWAALLLSSVPLLYGAAAFQLETVQAPVPPVRAITPVPIVQQPPSVEGNRQVPDHAQKADVQSQANLSRPFKRWLRDDVSYIITAQERAAFEQLSSDEARARFIEQFWRDRDPTPGTEENEFQKEHYRRIFYAYQRFAARKPGWRSDRGRAYIILGPPDEIESYPGGQVRMFPYEIWRYRSISEVGENVELEFVDPTMTGEYRLAAEIPPGRRADGEVNRGCLAPSGGRPCRSSSPPSARRAPSPAGRPACGASEYPAGWCRADCY
jgi:GWxTD domain-containing protein